MVCKFDNKEVLAFCVVALAALLVAPGAAAWSWPVDGPVLQRFTAEGDPYLGGQHRGVDIAAPAGADVRAPASGVVGFAGSVPRAGLTLTIRTEDGYSITLVQLGSIGVRVGTQVAEGDVVGTVGPSGEAEHRVPYVHLGIRLTAEPHGYVDPLQLLPRRETRTHPGVPTADPAPSEAPGAPPPGASATAPAEPPPALTAPQPVQRPAARARYAPGAPRLAATRTPSRDLEPVTRTDTRSAVRADPAATRLARPHRFSADPARPALVVEFADGATTAAAPRRSRRPVPRTSSTARRTSGWLAILGLLGLASCAAGILARRRGVAVPLRVDSETARKMSQIRLRLEARLAELDFSTDPRRGRLAIRQRPAPHRPCRRLRRSVRHLRALSPPARKPGADGQRHRRARHAGDGRRRPRREHAA